MTTKEHLRKAPIQEALIDIRCALSPDIAKLREVGALFTDDYPIAEELQSWHTEFTVKAGGSDAPQTSSRNFPVGLRFWSEDRKRLVQVQGVGFTFNRLHPYEDWNALRSEARRLWDHCRTVVPPERVDQVTVRFINSMDFPVNIADVEKYLNINPRVPLAFSQGPRRCMTRLEFPQMGDGAAVALTLAMEDPGPNRSRVMLDISASVTRKYSGEEEIWEVVEGLREVKNNAFFDSITDETKDLYQ
ncbi:MAG: TIGR04255 family protein [Pseudomonadota bacterium]